MSYRPWKEWSEDDYIVGKFVGTSEDSYEKTNWQIQVMDAEFAKRKVAEALIGKTIGLNSSGQLDRAMEQAAEGSILQITYKGMAKMEKGKFAGKDAHQFEVEEMEEEGAEVEEDLNDEEIEEDDL